MKRISILVVMFMGGSIMSFAQWTPNAPTTGDISFNGRNVGIGTTPAGRLHVLGVGYFGNENSNALFRVSIGGSGTNYGSIGSGYKYGLANFQHTYAVSDYASQIRFDLGGFNFLTAPVGTAGNPVSAMNTLQNGNVGIGVPNPQNKLEINAAGLAGINVFGNNSSYVGSDINISRVSTAEGVGRGATIQLNDVGSSSFNVIQNSTGGLQFFNNYNGLGWIERMRLSSNGNVGIVTTDPKSFKLAVNGKIWATEVQVALAIPEPDYVFEETYNLPSLTDIENYIKQNKHLPEVPSACEMEENGINLSEMNMILLKKVEELTLYQIQSIKRIQVLEEELSKLKNKVNEE